MSSVLSIQGFSQTSGFVALGGHVNPYDRGAGYNSQFSIQVAKNFWLGPEHSYFSFTEKESQSQLWFDYRNHWIQLNLRYIYRLPLKAKLDIIPLIGLSANRWAKIDYQGTRVGESWSLNTNLGLGIQTPVYKRLNLFIDYVVMTDWAIFYDESFRIGFRLFWGKKGCGTCPTWG